MSSRIVSLRDPLEADVTSPAPDRIVRGAPEQRLANYFSDASGQFFAGRWQSTPGAWRIRYTESELCVIVEGKVTIRSEDGESWTFGPGDAFVVPSGFSGTWEVIESCTKIYAVFESRT